VTPDARVNRATHQVYEPGSTFKLVTMAAALEADLLGHEEKIDCEQGKYRVGRGWIRDHKPFGLLTPAEIIANSSNVGMMKIGERVGAERLYDMIRAFGFGQRTGIQLEGEERGLVKPVERWSGRSCATISFGQEVSVTPLQLCRAVAAIAFDGQLRAPRLVLRKLDRVKGEVEHYPPVIQSRAVSEETAAELRRMMAGVVAFGTGTLADSDKYRCAGKTGTAQKIIDGTYSKTFHIASFAGFAPLEDPRIAVVVVLDDVRRPNHHGGQVAAPVFRQVVDDTLRRLALPSGQDLVLTARAGRPADDEEEAPAKTG
jgi:cell division protein FtsI (penicillin-binding protein 3)